jgi:hypothetical protein
MKLSGQIHAPTALPPEKKPDTNFQELLQIPFSHASTLARKGVHQREEDMVP